jgi:hypothetical protein
MLKNLSARSNLYVDVEQRGACRAARPFDPASAPNTMTVACIAYAPRYYQTVVVRLIG